MTNIKNEGGREGGGQLSCYLQHSFAITIHAPPH